MKKGSLLLFIDNKMNPERDILVKAISKTSYEIVHEGDVTAVLDREIYSEIAEVVIEIIKDQPVLSAGTNIMMLIQKK